MTLKTENIADIEKFSPPGANRLSRIALVGGDLAQWSGGNDFLRTCAGGLWQRQRSSQTSFSLLLTEDTALQALRGRLSPLKRAARDLLHLRKPTLSKAVRLERAQVVDAVSSFGGELKVLTYHDGRNSCQNLNRLLNEGGFDVAAPISAYRGELSIPWVGYIPDLQHKHHPEFFSSDECSARDVRFSQLLEKARVIIVNSIDTKTDIEKSYPGHSCKVFNLPFAPILNPAWLKAEPGEVIRRYNLPQRYFLISNQFWVHKSHRTGFEALAQLGRDYADVMLVCTGNTSDYRHPDYFRSLQDHIIRLKVQDRIQILGLIPKHDQIQIMRGAVAVIQPTLFEGGPGGGSVYDAVCTGTPVILSNIPVNREIDDATARIQFFEKANVEDLTEQMRIALNSDGPRPSNEQLQANSDRRAALLGERLIESCHFARSSMSR